jgi:acetoin utilization deacetylase AcuC-like enzyme
MLPFKLIYSDGYYLPIGAHVFPAEKFRRISERLLETKLAQPEDFLTPHPAKDEDILLVHKPDYVHKLKTGTLSPREEMQLEVPYSPELVQAFWLAAGGSILAARQALEDGVAISIGGGFHHAFSDHGEGFCMINDVAVAIRRMQHDGKVRRAMTVDCDVHQGNGTASIFAGMRIPTKPLPSWSAPVLGRASSGQEPEPLQIPPVGRDDKSFDDRFFNDKSLGDIAELDAPESTDPQAIVRHAHDGDVFTISLHQQNNYPAWKPPSSIDVDLPDGIGDDDYLAWLDNALSSGLRHFEPELICYIAGADPYKDDQLGGLALTLEGLQRRDELVFKVARARNIPVMVTYAGGYAHNLEDTVTIHCNTVQAAKNVFGRPLPSELSS